MIKDYFRRKKINAIDISKRRYYDFDVFKDVYSFDVREVRPSLNITPYKQLKRLSEYIYDICKNKNVNVYNSSLIFNNKKLYICDLEEVVRNLPEQFFFPVFEKYFPDIKDVFLDYFIENIKIVYNEVKNKIVNYIDMRYIIDPMNVAINKTMAFLHKKFFIKSSSIESSVNVIFDNICKRIWFGDITESEYELSLSDFFRIYEHSINVIYVLTKQETDAKLSEIAQKNVKTIGFWDELYEGLNSAFIMYMWYIACDYFYNSDDEEISYIRTDAEMFYMRSLNTVSVNYIHFVKLLESKSTKNWFNFNDILSYYSSFIDFVKIYNKYEYNKYIENIKHIDEIKKRTGTDDYTKISNDDNLEMSKLNLDMSVILNHIYQMLKFQKNNISQFDVLNRLTECIIDKDINGVEICRPTIYLDLATPKGEYEFDRSTEEKK